MSDIQSYYDRTRACLGCCLCQPVCPVFRALRRETASPRGKVHLVRELLEGHIRYSRRLRELLDLCLDCRQCAEACPAGIPVPELVLAARAEFVRRRGMPWLWRLTLREVLGPHGFLLDLTFRAVLWRWGSGIPGSTAQGILNRLPPGAGGPSLRRRLAGHRSPPGGKGRVGFFAGCLADYLYPESGGRAVRALEKAGYQVVVPVAACCGQPHLAAGDEETAYRLALRNLAAFAPYQDLVAVVTDCASCAGCLRRYETAFASFPRAADLAALAGLVREVTEFLAAEECLSSLALAPASGDRVRITYHDPCHLSRTGGDRQAPRRLLRALPGQDFVEMAEADRCCGGGGSFSLTHPEVAEQVLERKISNILASGARVVATSCPLCRARLAAGLRARQARVDVVYPVDLLAAVESD